MDWVDWTLVAVSIPILGFLLLCLVQLYALRSGEDEDTYD